MFEDNQLDQLEHIDIYRAIASIERGDHDPKTNPKRMSYFFWIRNKRVLQKSVWRHAYFLKMKQDPGRLNFQSAALHRWLVEAGFAVFHELPSTFASEHERELLKEMHERLARPDQYDLRLELLHQCNFQCEVSGCEVPEALEAAHIVPHASGGNSSVMNALLLRADLHRLYDRGLMTIRELDGAIAFSAKGYPQDGFQSHLKMRDGVRSNIKLRNSAKT